VVEAADVEREVKITVCVVSAQGEEPESTATMNTIILMLEGHLDVPFPPPPASS
jgi:hypothetical protein